MDSDGASEETTFERVKELPKRGGAATLARPRTRSRSLPLRTGPRQNLHRAFRKEVLKRFMKDDLEVATDATLVGFAGPKSQQIQCGDDAIMVMANGDVKHGIIFSSQSPAMLNEANDADNVVQVLPYEAKLEGDRGISHLSEWHSLISANSMSAIRLAPPSVSSHISMPHISKNDKVAKSLVGRSVLVPVQSLSLNNQPKVVTLPAATPILPDAWTAHVTADGNIFSAGRTFFHNARTGRSQYEFPNASPDCEEGITLSGRAGKREDFMGTYLKQRDRTVRGAPLFVKASSSQEEEHFLFKNKAGNWMFTNDKDTIESGKGFVKSSTIESLLPSEEGLQFEYWDGSGGWVADPLITAVTARVPPPAASYKYKCIHGEGVKYLSEPSITASKTNEHVAHGQVVTGSPVDGKETIVQVSGSVSKRYLPLVLNGELLFERIIPLPSTVVDDATSETKVTTAAATEPNTLKCSTTVENSTCSTYGGFFDVLNKSGDVMEVISLIAGHADGGDKGKSSLYVRKEGGCENHEMKADAWELIWSGKLEKNKSTNLQLSQAVKIEAGSVCGFYIHSSFKGVRFNEGGDDSGRSDENMMIRPGNYHGNDTPFKSVTLNRKKYTPAGSVTYRLLRETQQTQQMQQMQEQFLQMQKTILELQGQTTAQSLQIQNLPQKESTAATTAKQTVDADETAALKVKDGEAKFWLDGNDKLYLPEGVWLEGYDKIKYDQTKWQLGTVIEYDKNAACVHKVSFSDDCLAFGLKAKPRSYNFSRLTHWCLLDRDEGGRANISSGMTSFLCHNLKLSEGEGVAKDRVVTLASGLGQTKNFKPGEEAIVTYGPDSDGDFKVKRLSDGAELRYFKKNQLKLAHFKEWKRTSKSEMPEYEAIHAEIFSPPRSHWIVFEEDDNGQSMGSAEQNRTRLMKAIDKIQAISRSWHVRAVQVPARKEEVYQERLQRIMARAALLMQAMLRGRYARWTLLPKQRKQRRTAIAEARKKEVADAAQERRAKVEGECNEMLGMLSQEARKMLNFEALVDLKMDLEYDLVGLSVVKEWAEVFLKECLQYIAAGGGRNETRHILLTGSIGSGKHRAAEVIGKTLFATGHINSEDLVYYRKDVATTEKTLLYCETKWGDVVSERIVKEYGGVTIISNRSHKTLAQATGGFESFIKREPTRIHLPCLTSIELAEISLRRLAVDAVVPNSITIDLLVEMIEYKWSDGERRKRGIYLVNDIMSYLKAAEMRSVGRGVLAQQESWRSRRKNLEEEMSDASKLNATANDDDLAVDRTVRSRIVPVVSVGGVVLPEFLGLPNSVMQRIKQAGSDNDVGNVNTRKQADEDARKQLAEQTAARAAIDKEIEELVGMNDVKKWFNEMRGKLLFVEQGGNSKILHGMCLNMCLTGNPGTGKTTLARLMFKFLRVYGVLKKDVFIEMNALELKGKYCGWTAPLVKNTIASAMGGALFLDEAYALAGSETGNDSFSGEAIRTLLTELENNRTSVMVIVAGYRDKMASFMRGDPGLPRRFPSTLHLPDYSPDELSQIVRARAASYYEMKLGDGVEKKLVEALKTRYHNDIKGSNAGLAVKLVEQAVSRLANRVSKETERRQEELPSAAASLSSAVHEVQDLTLTDADFDLEDHLESSTAGEGAGSDMDMEAKSENEPSEKQKLAIERAQARKDALGMLESMEGMENAKAFVKKILLKVKLVEKGANRALLETCSNLVLTGNPGCGKTSFARIFHRVLYTHGVVRSDSFVEKNALELKGAYVGQTTPRVLNAMAAAKGGTIFLDEFPALAAKSSSSGRDSFANDAVRTLLTEIENNRGDVCVILAGYAAPMESALDADPGLRRRFPLRLHLQDYDSHVLARIGARYAESRFSLALGKGVEGFLAKRIATCHKQEMEQQNASLPIRLVELAIERMAERVLGDDTSDDSSTGTDEEEMDSSMEGDSDKEEGKAFFQTLMCDDFLVDQAVAC